MKLISTVANLRVLYEDNHLIVVNKYASDIVQGDKTGDTPLSDIVKGYIKKKYDKPGDVFLGVVHRLDRPVSGVVIFARTTKALTRMNKMFQDKLVQKTYWAIVKNKPTNSAGSLVQYLRKNEAKNKSNAYPKEVDGSKRAELNYRLIGQSDRYFLVEIDPRTGRHHQIRVQLASMGCPIKGDLKYGFDRSNKDASVSLHARMVEFEHPVLKEPIKITAPVPDDVLWATLEKLV